MDLARFPRRRYTHAPTPIEPLPHFTKALAALCPGGVGPEIWIKRDDLLGLFPGGNKTRKLEFLAADALAQGADTLITCGAPQSNHCRITLSAAIKEGLKCQFVIEERVPGSYRKDAGGNNFMFELMGVEAITVVPGGSDMAAAMSKVAQEVAALGRRGYVIPGGGSNAIGGLGYVACVQEMQQQWLDMGLALDAVVVGSGSSGTHGGMVAGFFGNSIRIPLIGIGVSRDPADQEPLVHKEAQAVADLLGIGKVPRDAVKSVGGQDGGSRPDAGENRGHSARSRLYGKDHGGFDRPRASGPFRAQRQGALHAHRRPALAPCLRGRGAWPSGPGRLA